VITDRWINSAARVKPIRGDVVDTIEDRFVGDIKDANAAAAELGMAIGMTAKKLSI